MLTSQTLAKQPTTLIRVVLTQVRLVKSYAIISRPSGSLELNIDGELVPASELEVYNFDHLEFPTNPNEKLTQVLANT